ncbi:MAG: hypothetical protein R3D62_02470 [Xanthobacteraceae bacterium]
MADEPDLEKRVSTIETRLSDYEKHQKAIADSWANTEKNLQENLNIRDDRINLLSDVSRSIQKQNDDLQQQSGRRWSFVTGMLSLVGIAFAVNFGYEIFRVKEVMNAKTFLEDGSRVLSENAENYSRILTALVHADILLSQAHREFRRNSYIEARLIANSAIEHLNEAVKLSGFPDIIRFANNVTYDRSNCTLISEWSLNLTKTELQEVLKGDWNQIDLGKRVYLI